MKILDFRAKREERAAARSREELIRTIRYGENTWRAEIERLVAENKELRAQNEIMRSALKQAHDVLREMTGENDA